MYTQVQWNNLSETKWILAFKHSFLGGHSYFSWYNTFNEDVVSEDNMLEKRAKEWVLTGWEGKGTFGLKFLKLIF